MSLAKRKMIDDSSADPLDALADEQMRAHLAGDLKLEPGLRVPFPMVDLRKLRRKLGLTQKDFAERFGFALGTLRNWEQARRLPDRSTRIYLRLIEKDPSSAEKIASEF